MLLQLLIIGLLIYFAVRLFRGRSFSNGWRGGGGAGWPPRSAGAAAAPVRVDRGRDINLSDADLGALSGDPRGGAGSLERGRSRAAAAAMTPEMLGYFSEELTRNTSQGVRNSSPMSSSSKAISARAGKRAMRNTPPPICAGARRLCRARRRAAADPDYLVSGEPRQPVEAEEVWTFVRRRGGDWLLSAIQQV